MTSTMRTKIEKLEAMGKREAAEAFRHCIAKLDRDAIEGDAAEYIEWAAGELLERYEEKYWQDKEKDIGK